MKQLDWKSKNVFLLIFSVPCGLCIYILLVVVVIGEERSQKAMP
jgi:hypothetical protein